MCDMGKDNLKEEYGKKLEAYISYIIENLFNFPGKIQYDFFERPILDRLSGSERISIPDDQKAYVEKGILYISVWAMKQRQDDLMRILIHELHHLKYPKYIEDQIVKLTEEEFGKYKKIKGDNLFICQDGNA